MKAASGFHKAPGVVAEEGEQYWIEVSLEGASPEDMTVLEKLTVHLSHLDGVEARLDPDGALRLCYVPNVEDQPLHGKV